MLFFYLFPLFHAGVIALQIVFDNSEYEKCCKIGDLSDIQKGQIVVVRLAGGSVTQTATVLGVSRAAVSKVMVAYTNHRNTSSAERNSGQKPKLSARDHHTLKEVVSKSQNCSNGDRRTQYSS